MIAAIHQPLYLPWQPYFGKIASSDVFVILDDVQYPVGKGYFNRNYIKSANGPVLLTVPLKGRGDKLTIREIALDINQDWQNKHWKTIQLIYGKAPYFAAYSDAVQYIYLGKKWENLCELNIALICKIAELIGLKTKFICSSKMQLPEQEGLQRLIAIVKSVQADQYLTGAGAGTMRYMDEDAYMRAGIGVLWHKYEQHPYRQLWRNYIPDMCILDLLFNCGTESAQMLLDCSTCVRSNEL